MDEKVLALAVQFFSETILFYRHEPKHYARFGFNSKSEFH